MKIRVRFAPSPTGMLHIGSLRAALYNYLFARHNDGKFILRIEDTDRARLVPEALQDILETLAWAGIDWDEGPKLKKSLLSGTKLKEQGAKGPYVQSKRLKHYQQYAKQLVEQGNAYHCFCSSERLTEMRKKQEASKQPPMYDGTCFRLSGEQKQAELAKGAPYVIRLMVPTAGETIFTDLIRGEVRFENKTIDDQVLLKSDGHPTYHLANVVDDHLMEITHVIRGEEWISSTPKHILLYQAFGWTPPEFAHLPLLLNSDRSKLSKRTGDVAAEDYKKKGYLPEALVNFVALLGWNPRADQEIYTPSELAKEFDIKKVNKSGAVVNFEKLDWINGEYIRRMDLAELRERAAPWLGSMTKGLSLIFVEQALALARDRANTLAELPKHAAYFFDNVLEYPNELLAWKNANPEQTKARLERTHEVLGAIGEGEWSEKLVEEELKSVIEAESLGTGDTLWPMRVALSGRTASASPFEIAGVLGKEKTLTRISIAIEKL